MWAWPRGEKASTNREKVNIGSHMAPEQAVAHAVVLVKKKNGNLRRVDEPASSSDCHMQVPSTFMGRETAGFSEAMTFVRLRKR
ncbi:unnamed protein product [Nippostrongylus brasiliensis]|uniref:XS domain-containing protein n=1 Tax=Nippostrongylus brasiliensis TaxID=27835 RepID=A0A0N4Y8N6_NIPBR|nr:hypothetical protein Q1695_008323 [Nippostrongylus brasiliensis]VDL76192.1 unnamed protein product [Nippostrongylus brasiliensis]